MDLVLKFHDDYLLTPYVYPKAWSENWWVRQYLSLFVIVTINSFILYLFMAGFAYMFIFDKTLTKHPKFLKNQVRLEIIETFKAIPVISVLTNTIFLFEVRGHSQLYDNINDSKFGWYGVIIYGIAFILFTDMCIYWIHRGLHHKLIYKHIHKPHHRWIVPSPFASHAFHPLDGFLQSVPYHIYAFLFPIHKIQYLCMFFFVNIWTVSIHDADYRVMDILKPFINGSAHHTDHHLFFNCNYGQFFTLWDRIGGSFKEPTAFNDEDPKSLMKKSLSSGSNGTVYENSKKE